MVEKIKGRFEIREILKFLIGGGSAVLIDAVIYAVLKQKINLSIAKAISYVSGAIVGFTINKLWTFESKRFLLSEVIKYICATGMSTVINFLGQKFIVFRKSEQ